MGSIGTLWVNLSARVTGFMSSMGKVERKLRMLSQRMKTIGRDMTFGVTMPVIYGVQSIINTFTDWEDSFYDIKKTVEGTEEQFQQLGAALREMAVTAIPLQTKELNVMASRLGQLGVHVADLVPGVRTLSAFIVSTGMDVDNSAIKLQRLANITRTAQSDMDRLAGTVVDLGNNTAALEDEILEASFQIAGIVTNMNMATSEVVGWAAGMTAAGVKAHAAGSFIGRTFIEIHAAVLSGGRALDTFAAISGKSADQFRADWSRDRSKVVLDFLEGLGYASQELGADLENILEGVDLGSIRLVKSAMATAGAVDSVREAVERSNPAWAAGNAHFKEFSTRMEATSKKFALVRNKLQDLAFTVGKELADAILELIESDGFKNFTVWLKDTTINIINFNNALGQLPLKATAVMAGLGPVMFFLGSFNQAIWGMVTSTRGAIGILKMVKWAAIAPWFAKIGAVIGGLSATTIAIVAAIVAAVGAMIWVWHKWGDEITQTVYGIYLTAVEFLVNKWVGIKDQLVNVWGSIRDTARAWSAEIQGFFYGIYEKALEWVVNVWDTVKTKLSSWFESIKGVVSSFANAVSNFFAHFGINIPKVLNTIGDTAENVGKAVAEPFVVAAVAVSEGFEAAGEGIKRLATDVPKWLEEMRDRGKAAMDDLKASAKEVGETADTIDFIGPLPQQIPKIAGPIQSFLADIKGLQNATESWGDSWAQTIADAIQQGNLLQLTWRDWIGQMINDLYRLLAMKYITNPIKDAIGGWVNPSGVTKGTPGGGGTEIQPLEGRIGYGGGVGKVIVNNYGGNPIDVKRKPSIYGEDIEIVVGKMKEAFASGGLDPAMATNYGLSRMGVRR